MPMQIAVVIVNYRTPELVLSCLDSIAGERATVPGLRAMVIDNASGDDSVRVLSSGLAAQNFAGWAEFVPLGLNGGFGWGNNQAILRLLRAAAPPDAFLLLNPDTRIEPGAIRHLAEYMTAHPDAGAVGSQLLDETGATTASAFRFPSVSREFMRGGRLGPLNRLLGIKTMSIADDEPGPIDWVTGASVLLRTRALHQSGLFDTGFFLYFEEVELMHRLRSHGWTCYRCHDSRVIHIAGAATGVCDEGKADDRAPPAYLLASRRRYFALTAGRSTAALAAWAWLAGSLLGQTIYALRQRAFPSSVGSERAVLIQSGNLWAWRKVQPAIATCEDPIDQPPAWMADLG